MSIQLPPATLVSETPALVEEQRGVGLWKGAFRRMRRNPTAIAGALIVLGFVLIAVFAPLAVVDHLPAPHVKGRRFDTRYKLYGRRNHMVMLARYAGRRSPLTADARIAATRR